MFPQDKKPMLIDPAASIVRKKTWNGYVLLRLKSPRIARRSKPGQFLMVKVSDKPYPLLRRPLSVHARDGDFIELFFARAGLGTGMLADKKSGETLDILGPLGKGFSLPRAVKGKTFCLVGGGRGMAPLYFLARELRARGGRPRIFYGGKTESDLPLLQKLAAVATDVFISTDDGSLGFRGFASAMFERELARSDRPSGIYACGPDPMMKKVAEIARERRLPAQLSLESIMGCGIGACWSCVQRIRRPEGDEWVKICEEGPVFPAGDVIWAGEKIERLYVINSVSHKIKDKPPKAKREGIDLSVDLGFLKLRNPVIAASGTFGTGLEFKPFIDLEKLGAIVVKGLYYNPRPGNPPPRLAESPSGLINSIGLQGIGVRAFCGKILPRLRDLRTPVIVNVCGETDEEYAAVIDYLNRDERVAAYELNISCPNVTRDGRCPALSPDHTFSLVKLAKGASRRPLIVKLSPNVTDIVSVARAAEEGGADGLSLINTLLAMAIDIETRRPRLANIFGGLSGPAIKPIALRMVYQVASQAKIPVIGMGGIMNGLDALEFLIAGARAVEVGTANLVDPRASIRIVGEIRDYCREKGVFRIEELIGTLETE